MFRTFTSLCSCCPRKLIYISSAMKFKSEYKGTTTLRNGRSYLAVYSGQHRSRHESSASPLKETEISQNMIFRFAIPSSLHTRLDSGEAALNSLNKMLAPHSFCMFKSLLFFLFIINFNTYILFSMAQQPIVVQSLPIIEASQSHSDTPHAVGLLWTSAQPYAETST